MALEQVFRCPQTRTRLRGGPLCRLLDGFCDWLLSKGFSRWSIRKHLANVSHFNQYLGSPTAKPRATITARDVEGFFRAYPSQYRNQGSLDKHLRRVRSSINRFIDYLHHKGQFGPLEQQAQYQPLVDAYMEWMRTYRHAAEGTVEVRAHCIRQFLEWFGPEATPQGLERLCAEKVEAFFLWYASRMGRSARRSMQSALRTFFRFCLHHSYIHRPLDLAVPTLRTYKLSTVPRGLTETQAREVLGCINRTTDVGRRDYAIIHLLHTYGVRGGQVRALRFEDIDWAENRILFRASKHGKDSLLPLTREVGESLLDYLQNSRSGCSFHEVFLTCRAPYHPLLHSSVLSSMVDRRIRAAGIDIPSKGAHAFRHGFATRMVEEGHSLKAVADVLGHRHLATTFIYTKVDFNALKHVALDWPQEVSG